MHEWVNITVSLFLFLYIKKKDSLFYFIFLENHILMNILPEMFNFIVAAPFCAEGSACLVLVYLSVHMLTVILFPLPSPHDFNLLGLKFNKPPHFSELPFYLFQVQLSLLSFKHHEVE